jgi:prevent-host-death family protein
METVGVRDLANRASTVLDGLEEGGQPVIVTRRGHPVAVLSAIRRSTPKSFTTTCSPTPRSS